MDCCIDLVVCQECSQTNLIEPAPVIQPCYPIGGRGARLVRLFGVYFAHVEQRPMVFKSITLTASNETDIRTDLTAFATQIGFERAASKRYGIVFLLGLFAVVTIP
jgi:hypothetical protein